MKGIMKKLAVLGMAAVLALGAFALVGCKDRDGTVLKVAGLKGAYGDEYWKQLEKGFEKAYPDVDVQLTIEAKIENTIRPQILAGAGPDVLYLATNREEGLTEVMIKGLAMEPLTGLLEQKVYNEDVKLKDRVLSTIMGNKVTNPYENDETHYMLPLFFSSNGLFFDADRFYAHATPYVAAPKDGKYMMPTTWTEFLALGAELAKAGNDMGKDKAHPALFTYPQAGYLDTLVPASIAASAGLEKLDQCFNYADGIWSDPQVAKVFENLGALRPYVHPNTVTNANATGGFKDNQQYVIDGKALFMTNGDWVKGEMAETTPASFNWGSSPFLAFTDGGARYGTVNAEQIYIAKASKVKDVAKNFLLYLYSREGLEIIAKHGNGAMVPARGYDTIAVEQGMNAGAVEGYKGYYDGTASILIGGFVSASAEGVDWKATYCKSMDSVMNGTMTVQQWLDKLEADSDKLRAAIK